MAWLGLAWLGGDCKNYRQCPQGISTTLATSRPTCCCSVLHTISPLRVGPPGKFREARFAMDDLAEEDLLDTCVRIQALPIWQPG